MTNINSSDSFYGLGIAPKLLDILDKAGFKVPTPIQHKAIPAAIEGKDIVGIAQTGTGKTLAFGIPMLQRMMSMKGKGLILLPTRELALQVQDTLQKIGASFGLRTILLIGGAPIERQKKEIAKNPHIVVGTPGRILDHIQQRTLNLSAVGILVLDEADRMLDMGFAPQINKILHEVPKDRQTMLFSATMPADIVRIASGHMKTPVRVEIARAGTLAERVEQELFMVPKDQKLRLLDALLAQYKGTVLVFSRTKHGARKICRAVQAMGHTAAEIHSNRSLNQRFDALEGFKSGKYRVLIATDIASRGIDVKGIELVINFDVPDDPEDYVHRVGRTGRAGMAGKAITFVIPDQRAKIRDIERLSRMVLAVSKLPALPPERQRPAYSPAPYSAPSGPRRSFSAPHSHARRSSGYRGRR